MSFFSLLLIFFIVVDNNIMFILQKPLAVPDVEKKETCELPEICSLVLTFVTEIAAEQVKVHAVLVTKC